MGRFFLNWGKDGERESGEVKFVQYLKQKQAYFLQRSMRTTDCLRGAWRRGWKDLCREGTEKVDCQAEKGRHYSVFLVWGMT